MRIKFWGVRGSIAVPGKETSLYGGNTSCVEVRSEDGDIIIIDMGTGIRVLGHALLREFGNHPIEADIFITHTHWDHIQGFPFFLPLFQAENRFCIHGMQYVNNSLEDILQGQMMFEYFPISLNDLSAKISFRKIQPGKLFYLGKKKNIRIETEILNHPGSSLGYRIQGEKGETYVHICDCEHNKRVIDQRVVKFAQGADLLLHDSQYTPEEMQNGAKDGWGHSAYDTVLEVAKQAKVKRLVLFHHEPTHNDEFMHQLEKNIQKQADMETYIAKEGMTIEI